MPNEKTDEFDAWEQLWGSAQAKHWQQGLAQFWQSFGSDKSTNINSDATDHFSRMSAAGQDYLQMLQLLFGSFAQCSSAEEIAQQVQILRKKLAEQILHPPATEADVYHQNWAAAASLFEFYKNLAAMITAGDTTVAATIFQRLSTPGLTGSCFALPQDDGSLKRCIDQYDQAQFAYRHALIKFSGRCVEQLGAKLTLMITAAESIDSGKELYDLWADICEQEYAAFLLSEEYQVVFADQINTSLALKAQALQQLQQIQKYFNMPTQDQIDRIQTELDSLRQQNESQAEQINKLGRVLFKSGGKRLDGAAADDDLQLIRGIGSVMAARLQAVGIYTFGQLAGLDQVAAERLEHQIKSDGRLFRYQWISQARQLLQWRDHQQ